MRHLFLSCLRASATRCPLPAIPPPRHGRIALANPIIRAVAALLLLAGALRAAAAEPLPAGPAALTVTTMADSGPGSLRQVLLEARQRTGPQHIRFARDEHEAGAQTLRLHSPLPILHGELILDGYAEGYLWKPNGIVLSGENHHPVLQVAPDAKVTLNALTIAGGHARRGGGVLNHGELVVKGTTFRNNIATRDGGGLANLGGRVTIINSTFVDNRAGQSGGGLTNDGGDATITHATFAGNAARQGAGLFSHGRLRLSNTILANSRSGLDCVAQGTLDTASTHNLIQTGAGCGEPVSRADPLLEPLGMYNGPTPTLPLRGGSPAINMADNEAAQDEHGVPLDWDQRGNGDPRIVAGYADIGAFEVQAYPLLRVNSAADDGQRACSGVPGDCTLRGAIELANAMGKAAVIRFDPAVFATPSSITLRRPLPEVTVDLTLDAPDNAAVNVAGPFTIVRTRATGKLTLHRLTLEDSGQTPAP
nr:right-handed parallel beta-helix repeat-containing protein [uncultured Pseudogulbenkiania sp.]